MSWTHRQIFSTATKPDPAPPSPPPPPLPPLPPAVPWWNISSSNWEENGRASSLYIHRTKPRCLVEPLPPCVGPMKLRFRSLDSGARQHLNQETWFAVSHYFTTTAITKQPAMVCFIRKSHFSRRSCFTLVCLFGIKITQKQLNTFPQNLVDGCDLETITFWCVWIGLFVCLQD